MGADIEIVQVLQSRRADNGTISVQLGDVVGGQVFEDAAQLFGPLGLVAIPQSHSQPVMGVMGPTGALVSCTSGQLDFSVACNATFYAIGVN